MYALYAVVAADEADYADYSGCEPVTSAAGEVSAPALAGTVYHTGAA